MSFFGCNFIELINEWRRSFIKDIQRLAQPGYTPTEEDVLRVGPQSTGPQSTGITETGLNMDGLSVSIIDVGNMRSERKKWIHCFERCERLSLCVMNG